MGRASLARGVRPAFTPERSSRAPSQLIFPCNSRRPSNWSSISRPPRRSALPSRPRSSPAPRSLSRPPRGLLRAAQLPALAAEDRDGQAALRDCALADRRLMALAGLWENWRAPAGEWMRSFAIITTKPNALCAELHNRMPVVLTAASWPAWLGEESADARHLKALLGPIPADETTCWPVSPRVGSVKNNDPSLIEPAAVAPD